jgi:serine/threonine protein kinase
VAAPPVPPPRNSTPGLPPRTSSPGLPPRASSPGLSSPGVSSPGISSPGVSAPGVSSAGKSSPGVSIPAHSGPVPTNEDGLPKRFGKYTLLRVLAKGGMAELFLAIQKSVAGFEKLIVIKRILPSMNQDKAFIEMLLHEARIAATLSHPNIVQIFDVGSAEGLYFIAMEHVHGEDIRSIVRGMKAKGVPEFPLEHALAIATGMCAGLAYAHEKKDFDGSELGIVHRDISPQNVVVTFSGDVKIVDFGIAKSDNKMATETKSGKLKGKVPYMSPEQAKGEVIDARSDIFATGVMLFELTTGKRLFKGSSEFETLKLICEREYPRPSQVRPGYPADLERIVMKSLAKDKAERYQSAREMQADLEEFIRSNRLPVSNIALSQFMQGLFEDKLASQKEALMQGKQLADIIEQQQPLESSLDVSQALLSTPAASHTVTDLPARGRGPMVFGGVAAVLLLVGGIGGTVWFMKQKQQKTQATLNAPPVVKVAKGSIEITSDPPGAAIWIDGDMRPEVTPATINQLPTSGRAIDVKLTKDGFESEKQKVTLSDASPKGTVKATLKKGSVVVDVTLSPESAKATLALDGKKYEGLSIESVSSGEQHKLVVAAPGYVDFETKFIGQPQEKKHFDVTLQKQVAVVSKGGGHVAVEPKGKGKLNVGASGGWCNVSVDGVAKGPTPLAGLELSSGPHKLTCTGEGKTLNATVHVPIDGTARYKFSL